MTWKPAADKSDWMTLSGKGEIQLQNLEVEMTGDYLGKRYQMDITSHYLEIFEQARLWRQSCAASDEK